MRSLLFVPADSPRKLEKSLASGADAVIVDLEDSIAPANKEAARVGARDFLTAAKALAKRPLLMLRVNALDSGLVERDLDVVMAAAPDAVMLPKSRRGATDLSRKWRSIPARSPSSTTSSRRRRRRWPARNQSSRPSPPIPPPACSTSTAR